MCMKEVMRRMQAPEQTQARFQSPRELATLTGKTYRTIQRAIKAGKIRTIRFGGSVMILSSEIKRILEHGWR
jgi:excisionase family DNA binding protein